MCHERKSRHPIKLLKLYSQYLSGASDEDLLNSGVSGVLGASEAELAKIKLFHTLVSQDKKIHSISCYTSIDLVIAKRLLKMYEQHTRGETVSHCPKRSKMTLAFTLLLSGLSASDLRERGLSDSEILNARNFIQLAPDADKLLLETIARQFNISRSTVVKILLIYRDNQAEMMQLEEMNDNRIPIPITA